MFAGIEAGGTKFVCAVGTGPLDVRAKVSIATTTPGETFARVIGFIEDQQQRFEPVRAIGIASFGPLDLREASATYGQILSTPKAGWHHVDVVGSLRRQLSVPIALDTDVNAAALAESRWGAGRNRDPVVYITVGTGIGGGVVLNGQPLHGKLHPEVGHVPVRRHADDAFRGSCPYHGACLEGLAAGPAIRARWGRDPAALGADLDRAVALEAWYLAQLVAMTLAFWSPERVILGGGVLKLPGLLDAVRAAAASVLNGYFDVKTSNGEDFITPPGLGDLSGVLGGLALARQVWGDT